MTIQFKLHHVGLLVEDFKKSLEFYQNVLEQQVTSRWQNRDRFNVAFVGAGSDAMLELVGPPFLDYEQAFVDKRGYGMNHIAFEVEDADAAFAELKAKGLRVAWEPRDMIVVRQCAFYDPDGILVEVFHHLDEDMPLMPPDLSQPAKFAFHHVDLLTEDWRRSQRFYKEHFGLKLVYEYLDDEGKAFLFFIDPFFDLETHNFLIEIIGPPFDEEREHIFYERYGTGVDHTAYVVDDVVGAWKRTLERGAENFVDPYFAYGVNIAWIRDPDGNDIEIMDPIPPDLIKEVLATGEPYRTSV